MKGDTKEYILRVYRSDCVVKRPAEFRTPPDGGREEVVEFSYRSRRRLAFVASNTDVVFSHMATLTYPREFPGSGRDVKRHLNAWLVWVKRRVPGVLYLWFMEFQKRGAPHLHVLLSSAVGLLRESLSLQWYKIVGSGDEKHLAAGTRLERLRSAEGGKRYAIKYAMKTRQKEVPKEMRDVGRFWGHSRGVKPRAIAAVRYEKYEDMERDLSEWPHVHHLRKAHVNTLYNATDWLVGRGVR